MRPVRLHVEGFGVFRSPVELDFDDVDYFAMVGPTGAGKSTIIDAICFALYGSIPRYGDERLVGRAVSVGGCEAKVSLTFDVAGARYHATRVVRLGKGKADALLERDVPGGTEVIASGAREMKAAVEKLLGLPFAHFTKCVVLPQGEFAKFLHDEPAKRRELLHASPRSRRLPAHRGAGPHHGQGSGKGGPAPRTSARGARVRHRRRARLRRRARRRAPRSLSRHRQGPARRRKRRARASRSRRNRARRRCPCVAALNRRRPPTRRRARSRAHRCGRGT